MRTDGKNFDSTTQDEIEARDRPNDLLVIMVQLFAMFGLPLLI